MVALGLTALLVGRAFVLQERNPAMQHLDISCNQLGEEAGRLILEGLDGNVALTSMDMRLTQFDKETEYQINVLMTGNLKSSQQREQ